MKSFAAEFKVRFFKVIIAIGMRFEPIEQVLSLRFGQAGHAN